MATAAEPELEEHNECSAEQKNGWTYAAKAVIKYGLPKIQHSDGNDDATERINALGEFAGDLARWLQCFASGLFEYRDTDCYKRARVSSGTPLG